MATIKVTTVIELDKGDEILKWGNPNVPVSISLTGDGSIHHVKFDGVDTTATAATLYLSTASPLSTGALLFAIKANQTGFITFGDLDAAVANADTSSVPIKANVWLIIPGQTFNVHGVDSAILRALNATSTIKEIYYARTGGGIADVECIGVI